MFVNFQSWWDVLVEELRVYIHHLNFCQLKKDLKQDEKSQNLLEELCNYHNLKTFLDYHHIKTFYRHCPEAELKTFTWRTPERMKIGRWCICQKRIIDLPHKFYTLTYLSVVRTNMLDFDFGGGF